MASSEDLQSISRLPMLQHMDDRTREHVAALFADVSTLLTSFEDDVLLHQGWLGGNTGFVLLRGEAVVEKEGEPPVTVTAPSLLGEMIQFNPHALRTATVRVKGEARVLRFVWPELYAQARQRLTETEQGMLMDGIEHSAWERFHRDALMDIAVFRGLPERLRLRVTLLLQWLVEPVALADGQVLFKEGEVCGGAGHVLLEGNVLLVRQDQSAQLAMAPAVLGVMPRFDADRRWTATAKAQGKALLLRFSWVEYVKRLQQRLTPQEQRTVAAAISANAKGLFIH